MASSASVMDFNKHQSCSADAITVREGSWEGGKSRSIVDGAGEGVGCWEVEWVKEERRLE